MSTGPSVIIADFDQERLEHQGASLSQAGLDPKTCRNGTELLECCREKAPQVAVVEAFLPRKNGFEVLKALKEDPVTSRVKVVLLLDRDDDYGKERARLCGADLVLTRPFSAEELVAGIKEAGRQESPRALAARGEPGGQQIQGVLEAMEEKARLENPLSEHITDPLTGLFNAAYTSLKLADEVKKVRRFYHPLSCVLVSLDDQEGLDDPQNAQNVRRIINEIAGILLCESRDIDHLARAAEHEFVCLLPHTDTPGAVTMAERILASVRKRGFRLGESENPLTVSAGVAAFAGTGMEGAEELLERARAALATSRQWGGNRSTLWKPAQDPQTDPKS